MLDQLARISLMELFTMMSKPYPISCGLPLHTVATQGTPSLLVDLMQGADLKS